MPASSPLVKVEGKTSTLKETKLEDLKKKNVSPRTPILSERKRSASHLNARDPVKKLKSSSPKDFQKSVNVSSPYENRTKPGKVELTYGTKIEKKSDDAFSTRVEGCEVDIMSGLMSENKRYMHVESDEKVEILKKRLADHAERIRKHYALPPFSRPGDQSQDKIVVYGRIRVERFPGEVVSSRAGDCDPKLSEKQGVLLEGPEGKLVKLDVSRMSSVSLFSGQLVVVQGNSPNGRIFVASRIFSGVTPAPPVPRPLHAMTNTERVWVASGPFTLPTNFEFRPLQDLLHRVKEASPRPDALILMGPFLPESHPKIASGDVVLDLGDDEPIEASFDELFHVKVASLLSAFVSQTQCKTRILLVPSNEDVHHDCVYPQPPFKSSLFRDEDGQDLTMGGQIVRLPNPALVRVGNSVIGVNCADVPVHLIRSGDVYRWSSSAGSSNRPHRFERFADHLVKQRNFYPLEPADRDIPLDMSFSEHLEISTRPDILLTRSNLSHFAKRSGETVFVNAGMLTRHGTGGTYAKFTVTPPKATSAMMTKSEDSSSKESEDKDALKISPVADRLHLEVVRI